MWISNSFGRLPEKCVLNTKQWIFNSENFLLIRAIYLKWLPRDMAHIWAVLGILPAGKLHQVGHRCSSRSRWCESLHHSLWSTTCFVHSLHTKSSLKRFSGKCKSWEELYVVSKFYNFIYWNGSTRGSEESRWKGGRGRVKQEEGGREGGREEGERERDEFHL